ncbi:CLUMA_CG019768, isoform A [Clunio marinus]|uniref:CLUMA_CG019768, isoform A n=1 Tax=Clunio marinus TaxID=568069 RepID=A0A1J1J285_9DIPT|nr:CLUMA_CG019768, isoform A [Clunio marinus]
MKHDSLVNGKKLLKKNFVQSNKSQIYVKRAEKSSDDFLFRVYDNHENLVVFTKKLEKENKFE